MKKRRSLNGLKNRHGSADGQGQQGGARPTHNPIGASRALQREILDRTSPNRALDTRLYDAYLDWSLAGDDSRHWLKS
jgi:hypothetical protein